MPFKDEQGLLSHRIPRVFAGPSLEAFCLHHRWHYSSGSLEHSGEIPLVFLRQGKRGAVLLVNTHTAGKGFLSS